MKTIVVKNLTDSSVRIVRPTEKFRANEKNCNKLAEALAKKEHYYAIIY